MTRPVTDRELASIREAQQVYMPSTGKLQRKKAIGGGNFSWGDLAADVRVRITAGAGAFRLVSDRYAGINPVVITFPHGTDVKSGDRFIDSDNGIYEVRETRSRRSYLTAIQCLCDFLDN